MLASRDSLLHQHRPYQDAPQQMRTRTDADRDNDGLLDAFNDADSFARNDSPAPSLRINTWLSELRLTEPSAHSPALLGRAPSPPTEYEPAMRADSPLCGTAFDAPGAPPTADPLCFPSHFYSRVSPMPEATEEDEKEGSERDAEAEDTEELRAFVREIGQTFDGPRDVDKPLPPSPPPLSRSHSQTKLHSHGRQLSRQSSTGVGARPTHSRRPSRSSRFPSVSDTPGSPTVAPHRHAVYIPTPTPADELSASLASPSASAFGVTPNSSNAPSNTPTTPSTASTAMPPVTPVGIPPASPMGSPRSPTVLAPLVIPPAPRVPPPTPTTSTPLTRFPSTPPSVHTPRRTAPPTPTLSPSSSTTFTSGSGSGASSTFTSGSSSLSLAGTSLASTMHGRGLAQAPTPTPATMARNGNTSQVFLGHYTEDADGEDSTADYGFPRVPYEEDAYADDDEDDDEYEDDEFTGTQDPALSSRWSLGSSNDAAHAPPPTPEGEFPFSRIRGKRDSAGVVNAKKNDGKDGSVIVRSLASLGRKYAGKKKGTKRSSQQVGDVGKRESIVENGTLGVVGTADDDRTTPAGTTAVFSAPVSSGDAPASLAAKPSTDSFAISDADADKDKPTKRKRLASLISRLSSGPAHFASPSGLSAAAAMSLPPVPPTPTLSPTASTFGAAASLSSPTQSNFASYVFGTPYSTDSTRPPTPSSSAPSGSNPDMPQVFFPPPSTSPSFIVTSRRPSVTDSTSPSFIVTSRRPSVADSTSPSFIVTSRRPSVTDSTSPSFIVTSVTDVPHTPSSMTSFATSVSRSTTDTSGSRQKSRTPSTGATSATDDGSAKTHHSHDAELASTPEAAEENMDDTTSASVDLAHDGAWRYMYEGSFGGNKRDSSSYLGAYAESVDSASVYPDSDIGAHPQPVSYLGVHPEAELGGQSGMDLGTDDYAPEQDGMKFAKRQDEYDYLRSDSDMTSDEESPLVQTPYVSGVAADAGSGADEPHIASPTPDNTVSFSPTSPTSVLGSPITLTGASPLKRRPTAFVRAASTDALRDLQDKALPRVPSPGSETVRVVRQTRSQNALDSFHLPSTPKTPSSPQASPALSPAPTEKQASSPPTPTLSPGQVQGPPRTSSIQFHEPERRDRDRDTQWLAERREQVRQQRSFTFSHSLRAAYSPVSPSSTPAFASGPHPASSSSSSPSSPTSVVPGPSVPPAGPISGSPAPSALGAGAPTSTSSPNPALHPRTSAALFPLTGGPTALPIRGGERPLTARARARSASASAGASARPSTSGGGFGLGIGLARAPALLPSPTLRPTTAGGSAAPRPTTTAVPAMPKLLATPALGPAPMPAFVANTGSSEPAGELALALGPRPRADSVSGPVYSSGSASAAASAAVANVNANGTPRVLRPAPSLGSLPGATKSRVSLAGLVRRMGMGMGKKDREPLSPAHTHPMARDDELPPPPASAPAAPLKEEMGLPPSLSRHQGFADDHFTEVIPRENGTVMLEDDETDVDVTGNFGSVRMAPGVPFERPSPPPSPASMRRRRPALMAKLGLGAEEYSSSNASSTVSLGMGSMASLGGMRRSPKRKLVVTGVHLEDATAHAAVRAWAESFGTVKSLERQPDGTVVIDWKGRSAADTVGRVQSKTHINGAGSVSLSWSTKRR
ncbi:hypothetical protein HGRIS_000367 [Hohenbuehelia grisea]|uniref:Proteophosphoglycan ppg4 n=1 Tax=Hohenbuehelia grisea TaxID=104357 RepID=A0ABR3JQU7_9AGAR